MRLMIFWILGIFRCQEQCICGGRRFELLHFHGARDWHLVLGVGLG
jgi:hypothetical protein